jgi:hypothetical protein
MIVVWDKEGNNYTQVVNDPRATYLEDFDPETGEFINNGHVKSTEGEIDLFFPGIIDIQMIQVFDAYTDELTGKIELKLD